MLNHLLQLQPLLHKSSFIPCLQISNSGRDVTEILLNFSLWNITLQEAEQKMFLFNSLPQKEQENIEVEFYQSVYLSSIGVFTFSKQIKVFLFTFGNNDSGKFRDVTERFFE